MGVRIIADDPTFVQSEILAEYEELHISTAVTFLDGEANKKAEELGLTVRNDDCEDGNRKQFRRTLLDRGGNELLQIRLQFLMPKPQWVLRVEERLGLECEETTDDSIAIRRFDVLSPTGVVLFQVTGSDDGSIGGVTMPEMYNLDPLDTD